MSSMAARNRSAPPYSVVPVLVYEDVRVAVDWLTRVFGFIERVQIGEHRAQLGVGDGAVIVADATRGRRPPATDAGTTHSVMVRVEDVDAVHRAVLAAGESNTGEPTDQPFGERQLIVEDLGGHWWTFTATVADMKPEDWGGVTVSAWPVE